LRQVKTALVAKFDHPENYFPICANSIARIVRVGTVVVR
jgi:hypothetical protein